MLPNQNEFELQDPTLWPNVLSFDDNQREREAFITKTIRDTKKQFFQRNSNNLLYSEIEHLLDESRDIYYPPKTSEPSYCKAGLHYSIPDQAVGIGLKVDPKYENDSEWAMLYHGTKPQAVKGILMDGLRPGGGQAHAGRTDPWGAKIPQGVYFSFWLNQSFAYTMAQNPIVMECFVKDVFVAPGCKGYAISNVHRVSRILVPLKKDRHNQLI